MKIDYKNIEGTRIGIFDVLECINPDCNNGFNKVKYRVKCSKCGYEKIVSRQFLSTVNHYNYKACGKCKRSYMIYDFKNGEVYGKYKVLNYVGLGNNSMRIYRVKCIKCGWEGDLIISSILNSMKSKNITCCHKDNHATSLKIGEIINERYLVVGKFTNQSIFKDNNFRYIVKCIKCNKLLYLTSDKIKRCVRSPKCSHKAYFYKEKFNKDDYIIDEKLLEEKSIDIKEDTMKKKRTVNLFRPGDKYGIFIIKKEISKKGEKRLFEVECMNCHSNSVVTYDALLYSRKHNAKTCKNCQFTKPVSIENKEDSKTFLHDKLNNLIMYAIACNKNIITDKINFVISNETFINMLHDNATKFITKKFEKDYNKKDNVEEFIEKTINSLEFTENLLGKSEPTVKEKVVEVPKEVVVKEEVIKEVEVPAYKMFKSIKDLLTDYPTDFDSENYLLTIIKENKELIAGNYLLVNDNEYYFNDNAILELLKIAEDEKKQLNNLVIEDNIKKEEKDSDLFTDKIKLQVTPIQIPTLLTNLSAHNNKSITAKKKLYYDNKILMDSLNAFRVFTDDISKGKGGCCPPSSFKLYCDEIKSVTDYKWYFGFQDQIGNVYVSLKIDDFKDMCNKFFGHNRIGPVKFEDIKKVWSEKRFIDNNISTSFNNSLNLNFTNIQKYINSKIGLLNYALKCDK